MHPRPHPLLFGTTLLLLLLAALVIFGGLGIGLAYHPQPPLKTALVLSPATLPIGLAVTLVAFQRLRRPPSRVAVRIAQAMAILLALPFVYFILTDSGDAILYIWPILAGCLALLSLFRYGDPAE